MTPGEIDSLLYGKGLQANFYLEIWTPYSLEKDSK